MEVNGKGEIISCSGLDEIWDNIEKQGSSGRQMANQMRQEMSDEAMREMMQKQAMLLPEEPVAPGAKWTVRENIVLPMIGSSECIYHCQLDSFDTSGDKQLVTIIFDGVITSDSGKTITIAGESITIDKVSFEQKGKLKFDLKTNIITEYDVRQEGVVEMRAQGQNVESDQVMEMSITVTPVG